MASPYKPQEKYSHHKVDRPYTKKYRVYFKRKHDGMPLSPFHDIPLYHDKEKGVLNMVVEIPRWSQAKFEISRNKSLNPIVQDMLDKKPRFVKNSFPYKGYIWNYGALPQTWEDPNVKTPETGNTKGDNDPLDACEIGTKHHHNSSISTTGSVKQVKVLGILGLIDTSETDWKVIVIDVKDPLAKKLHDIDDVETHLPGLLDATRDWFRIYKVPDGKAANEFAFGGRFGDKTYANKIIDECSEAWTRLITGKVERGDVSIDNMTLKGTPGNLDPDKVDLPPNEDLSPAPIEQDLDEWFFLDRDDLDLQSMSHESSKMDISLNMEE